jgi:hypothetical protein
VTAPCELRAGGPSAYAVPAHLVQLTPGATRRQPVVALRALAGQLPGGTRTTLCSDGVIGVLSTPAASVWTNGKVLWWATPGGEEIWPAADAEGAARRLGGPQ